MTPIPQPPTRAAQTGPIPLRHQLPLGVPTPVFFTDESGSKGSRGDFFVIGGLKTREPGKLLRAVRGVRERHHFHHEFKFSDLTNDTVEIYNELISELHMSDARLMAFVIDKRTRELFEGVPHWDAHATVTSQIVIGNLNKGEIGSLLMDECGSPRGVSVADEVKRRVNERLEITGLVSAVALDSRASDGLQLADLIASAVAFDRRHGQTHHGTGSPKSVVTRTLAARFGLRSFSDTKVRTGRVNILTSAPRRPARNATSVAAVATSDHNVLKSAAQASGQ